MRALQVPTRPVAVAVFTTDGERTQGLIYLGPPRFETDQNSEILNVLNDERAFIPFAAGDPEESQRLLNKDHIVRVRIDSEAEIDVGDLPCGTVLLSDSSRVTGNVMVDTPPEASRLIDKLNQAPRFFSVVTPDGVDFVQCAHITRVYSRM